MHNFSLGFFPHWTRNLSKVFSSYHVNSLMFTFCLWFQSVGQVHSEDADEGINGDIYYSLMDPKSSFAVDPVTGVISLTRPLSYQKKPRHEISVVAQDRGAKSRFATRAPDTATVHLSVRQVRKYFIFAMLG